MNGKKKTVPAGNGNFRAKKPAGQPLFALVQPGPALPVYGFRAGVVRKCRYQSIGWLIKSFRASLIDGWVKMKSRRKG